MNLLEARNVCFSYGGPLVLQNAAARFGAGELAAVVGTNGSGKTTLLKTLCGIHRPQQGSVFVSGRPLAELSRRETARKIAFVPQDSPIGAAFTIREVVAMGRTPHLGAFTPEREHDLQAVEQALLQTDLHALAGKRISAVSSGERRRAFLARALAQETEIIILDEPTANLDPQHQLALLDLLGQLGSRGKTIIVALHDLSLAIRCFNRVLVLDHGLVAAEGAPLSVLTPRLLADIFKVRGEYNECGGVPNLVLLPL